MRDGKGIKMNIVKPITPIEARAAKTARLPNWVIEVVNEMLIQKITPTCYSVTLSQDAIVLALVEKSGLDREAIFKHDYLDFEPIFRQHGWEVEYNKPAYYETGSASYKFIPKR
jgi:hypothetical protein